MESSKQSLKTAGLWIIVALYSGVIYVTLPYGPIIREKIYKSFPPKIIQSNPIKNKSFQIKEKDSILFCAEREHGIGIYDISRPDTLIEISRIASQDTTFSFFESRKIIYLADGSAGARIIDINKLFEPKELSKIRLYSKAYDIIINEQYALIAAGDSGLVIADVSNKENPILTNHFAIHNKCKKINLYGNIGIIGTENKGIFFIDLEDMSQPQMINSLPMPGTVTSILIYENYAYIACLHHGIKVIDISDIDSLNEVGFYATPSPIYQMYYRNGYLFAANGENGFIILNATKPQKLNLQRQFKTGVDITSMFHRYYYAYLADTSPRAYFVDIDTGRNFVVYFVAFILILVLIFVIIYLIHSRANHTIYNYFSMIIISLVYGYFLYGMLKIPIEAIHFLEYGLLGILVYIAFKNNINDPLIFFVSTALITLIGIGDEFLQWLLPNRSWDFRDVGFNALSGGLAQLAIWHGIAPRLVKNTIDQKSIRILKRYLLAVAAVFAILLSSTPQFNNKLATHVSFLKFLNNPEPITEYGYKVFHPDIGGFFSRFKANKLLQYDREDGKKVGEILNQHYRTSYAKFLEMYTPGNAPFIHEMRVHIFRRDRYFQDRRLLVAYKENLILENFFSNSLEHSLYKWRNNEMQQCREQLGEQIDQFYVSPVSGNVITSFNRTSVWISFFLFTGILFTVNHYLSRRKFK